jgi:hypothetical protein
MNSHSVNSESPVRKISVKPIKVVIFHTMKE